MTRDKRKGARKSKRGKKSEQRKGGKHKKARVNVRMRTEQSKWPELVKKPLHDFLNGHAVNMVLHWTETDRAQQDAAPPTCTEHQLLPPHISPQGTPLARCLWHAGVDVTIAPG